MKGTNEKDYRDRFVSLVSSLRSHGVAAPVYVAIATKCLGASNGGTRFHSADNPVARAQLALPDPGANREAELIQTPCLAISIGTTIAAISALRASRRPRLSTAR